MGQRAPKANDAKRETRPKVSSDELGDLGVAVSFAGHQVVLAVRGEVDSRNALDLEAVLDAVIDSGHRSVALQLARTGAMDAVGMGVIVHAADRLKSLGGELALRSPSALVRRVLEVAILAGRVRMEDGTPAEDRLGPEQQCQDGAAATGPSRAARGTLGRLMSVPADHEVLDAALRLVVALARATVGGADGVSVSLRRHGRLATVAASDQTISDMDADQYATGEGPCVDASLKGRWFHVLSLEDEHRWPAFTPRARKLGISAILSSPLTAGGQAVGALNIYSRAPRAFGTEQQQLAAVLAREASSILTSAGAGTSDDELSRLMADVLRSRHVISEALGVLMERDGTSEGSAFTTLRRFSERSGRSMRERAEDVVASTQLAGPPEPVPAADG
jgi:anti-anti-sigma factor